MHWGPFRSRETVTVFKRDPKKLCKWPVYFSSGMEFTEALEISHLKSAFQLYERPLTFDPFHQC